MVGRKRQKVASTRMLKFKNIRRSVENMASENYLEEALNAEVDETAVNAIMKTLEIQLNSSSSVSNQQENPAVLLSDPGNNKTEVSCIQECEVTNIPYCVAENPAAANIPPVITFSKSMNSDQPIVMPAIHPIPDDRQMDTCIAQQSDESVKLTENLKPLFLSGTKMPNCRPVFQSRSLPNNNNIGFSLFPTQTMLQATINENDGTTALSQSTNPLLVNIGNFSSAAENMKPESKSVMIKCTTPSSSTSDSPLLMNIVTVPITASNLAKLPETHTTTINSSRMIGRVALPKTIVPTATTQHIEGSTSNPILPNNVQVLSVIPLKPGTNPSKQSQKNMMPRMVIGAPQMMGNRVGPQVKMGVQPQPGQDDKPSQGHLLLKHQNGQYHWVRVNVATRSGSAIALSPPNSNTSTSAPPAVVQNMNALPKPNSSESSVGAQIPAQPSQKVKVQSVSNDLLTKEKCQTFLGKILELANTKGGNIKKNIYNLTQDLIDGKVDVEYFTHYLEVLLSTKTQLAFTELIKKSLPLIRHSLATKELVLDGIRAPPYYVCLSATTPVAVVPHFPNQSPIVSCTATQPSQQSILIQPSVETTSNIKSRELFWQTPTQFHTKVSPNNASNKASGIAQMNIMESPNTNKNFGINQPHFGQSLIRPRSSAMKATSIISPQQPFLTSTSDTKIPTSASISNVHQLSSSVTFQANEAMTVATVEQTYDQTKAEMSLETDISLATKQQEDPSNARSSEKLSKDKYYSLIDYSTDDINDVTTVCGVNLDDESQKLLNSDIQIQNRSSQYESFLNTRALLNKIKQITVTHGLKEPSSQVVSLISQACEENIKSLLEKLSTIAAHRTTKLHMNIQHEVIRDVKGQLKFLEEIDQIRKRHQDENDSKYDSGFNKMKGKHKKALRAEMVELRQQEANQTALQAIGFRKKTKFGNEGNPVSVLTGNKNVSALGSSEACIMVHAWPRIKRVSMQDMVFLLEQEKHTRHSLLLYKAYFKR